MTVSESRHHPVLSAVPQYGEPLPEFSEPRLFQEINLLKFEGQIFAFAGNDRPRKATSRSRSSESRELSEEASSPVFSKGSSLYGEPRAMAYKCLQAVFRKLTEARVPTYNVSFSKREIARLIGRSGGGRDLAQLWEGIQQLRHTDIHCQWYDKETDEEHFLTFTIFNSVLFSRKPGEQGVSQCVIQVEPSIVNSLLKNHYTCLNFARLNSLPSYITQALYKRLFYHFSNIHAQKRKRSFSYHKDYELICSTWLSGFSVYKHRSRIIQQLGHHLDALVKIGLLKTWDIVKKSDGNGFKLTCEPGPAFFEDYAAYYAPKSLSGQKPLVPDGENERDRAQSELVQYFFCRLYHIEAADEMVVLSSDLQFADNLLDSYSFKECLRFVDFALAQARKDRYNVRTFAGIKHYCPAFQAEQKKIEATQEEREVEVEASRQREEEEAYIAFCKEWRLDLRSKLDPVELADLERRAAEAARSDPQYTPITERMVIRLRVDEKLEQEHGLPSLEEWMATKQE